MYDLLIAGGRIVDGSGNPWFGADIGIQGGRIAKMGLLRGEAAQERIDLRGLFVSPGFIDIHSHSDAIPSAGKPHPRFYGTFPRVLGKYVREDKALTLPEGVRKMTSLPAQRLGLQDRGMVKVGMWADLVVFDPETIADKATFSDPRQHPSGIHYVLVNGQVAAREGRTTGALPGRILRKNLG